jgi:endoglucanase
MIRSLIQALCGVVCLTVLVAPVHAAKLVDVRTVDEETVQVYWHDAEVEWKDTGTGPSAFHGGCDSAGEVIHKFDPALDTAAAVKAENYELVSTADKQYTAAVHPTAAHRKTKVSGTDRGWPDCACTLEHTIYLRLPKKLQQGAKYTLKIGPAVKSDTVAKEFTFDVFASVSEAVHVNLVGYNPDVTAMKSADLYLWLGDGGARDYSAWIGRKVMLYNVATKAKTEVGAVAFWKKDGQDFGGRDLIRSDVWTCDFSAFKGTGTYRLVVEGVGCSPDFVLSRTAYYEPFRTSLRGYYYMRIGEGKEWAASQHMAIPRQPAFIPGKDPTGFTVFITTYGPFNDAWKKAGGDQWDNQDWSKYNEPGNPTNPNAWGGHSDATDWDRNPGHISSIWDLLLPYLLSGGKVGDDNCRIRESGNGLPDLLDEANFETDFWLRLRDTKGGYSCGLNNPSKNDTVMYQAAASPYMAWASAANAAMTADAMRVAKKPDLVKKYTAAAQEAWKVAGDQGLDLVHGIGNGQMRGRDLKFMAAAYLYNVTGDKAYEDAMVKECRISGPTSEIDDTKSNQLYGAAAYVMCTRDKLQAIHYPKLAEDMRAAIINEAMKKNVASSTSWPSRRSSNNAYGWFQSTQEVQTACAAHAFTADPAQKEALVRTLVLEADWGLGRNPMNIVQMTGLGSRCVEQMFTCGRNDGVPGEQPGHTPYMNVDAWGGGYMFDPRYYANKGYPSWDKWPHAEGLWPAPYCFANNEFTPQQSMRGKMCLYAYLYSLGETYKGP